MEAILLDIEGTTTPIDFVHKVLFPFAKERINLYIEDHFDELNTAIDDLYIEHSSDSTYGFELVRSDPRSVADYLKHLSDSDRKSTSLKEIQGRIWKAGYESGELRSIVFDDVPTAFERWKMAGKTIAIFSSGSVLAQKLIFKYSDHGDLTRFISFYFDTTTGPKLEPRSYEQIAIEMDQNPEELLFISDITEELDAARSAGFATALSLREGNAPAVEPEKYRGISSFSQVN